MHVKDAVEAVWYPALLQWVGHWQSVPAEFVVKAIQSQQTSSNSRS